MDALPRYLSRHAEYTAAWADEVPGEFSRTVVLPVLGESAASLEQVVERGADADALLIVVVNDTPDAAPAFCDANARMLERLGRQRSCIVGGRRCVVVDATASGHRLPPGQGVGLARKLGFDLALALWAKGRVRSPWMHSADADACWPADALSVDHPTASGLVFPFWHDTSALSTDPVHRATALYELWMRDYAAGLRAAGSPWGFVPLGSAMAVRASTYAAVGGMPRRTGGEDFYLLAKLGKVGLLQQADCDPVRIAARPSARAPFGTGPAVAAIIERAPRGDAIDLYAPSVFTALRGILGEARLGKPVGHPAFARIGGPAGLAKACSSARSDTQRRRKVDEWLDPLRTLRLVHAIEADGQPRIPWRQFFGQAEGSDAWAQVSARRRATMAAPGTQYGVLAAYLSL